MPGSRCGHRENHKWLRKVCIVIRDRTAVTKGRLGRGVKEHMVADPKRFEAHVFALQRERPRVRSGLIYSLVDHRDPYFHTTSRDGQWIISTFSSELLRPREFCRSRIQPTIDRHGHSSYECGLIRRKKGR